ncbi:hypothetical protein PHISP_03042 [Aspergillus sp. HF37]|nr:hypothetical protein PHISP_03042 [Aspergillus sp. HF37]
MAARLPSLPAAALRQPIAPRNCSASLSSLCPQARLIPARTRLQPSHHLNSTSTPPTQQRRTFLVQLKRQAQSLKEATTAAPSEPPVRAEPESADPQLQLTNLPYFIRRTASNQLPVYLVTKAGGTKQLTKIQKTEGDLEALRRDLTLYLDSRSSKASEISINHLNGHIIARGWRKPEIQQFLVERSF